MVDVAYLFPKSMPMVGVFVLAGSETTAALLTGCTYYLLQHREKYDRLVREIRGAFAQVSEIKLAALVGLPYLNAVLTERLRIYPPIPSMLPRFVPKGGVVINGQYVPGGVCFPMSRWMGYMVLEQFQIVQNTPSYIACKANTIQVSVSISLYSAFHSSTNFKESDAFIPERWLSGPESSEFISD